MSSSPFSSVPSHGLKLIAMLALSLTLSACDYVASFGKPKQTPEEAKAEGIALGAGCRQAGQSLEDCYQRNPDSLKAGIFAGWKDMHEYMAAKNIQTVVPPPPAAEKPDADAARDERAARRERRERERMEKEKGSDQDAKSKDRDGGSKSSRKNRDDSSAKK